MKLSYYLLAENLKAETKRLQEEAENLVDLKYGEIPVKLMGYNAMNDQKSLYSTLDISCTRRCVCGLLNDKHMEKKQKFESLEQKRNLENFVKQMCLSPLHFGLRLSEHLIGKYALHKNIKLLFF